MRIKLIPAIILGQLVLSAYLVHAKAQTELFCVIGKSCDAVQQSVYGELWGIDVSTLGLIAFGLLLITAFTQHAHRYNRKLYLLCIVLGVMGAIYFIGIQLFVLKQICSTCMVIDGSMLVVAWLEYRAWRKGY